MQHDSFPWQMACAKFASRWANRFRRALKGSAGQAGGQRSEPEMEPYENVPRIPVERKRAPDVLAFVAAPA